MFERFTSDARAVVVGAQQEARALGHHWIGAEHLLLAVASGPDDEVADALRRLGVTPESLTAALRDELGDSQEDAEALLALGIDLTEVRRRIEDRFGAGAELGARQLAVITGRLL